MYCAYNLIAGTLIFLQSKLYNFDCKNISVPAIRLYAQYIQIGDRDFDSWLEDFITKWKDQVISFYQPGNMQDQKDATATMDIDWINTDWVSGIFRFTAVNLKIPLTQSVFIQSISIVAVASF